jgi:hypothetical protein
MSTYFFLSLLRLRVWTRGRNVSTPLSLRKRSTCFSCLDRVWTAYHFINYHIIIAEVDCSSYKLTLTPPKGSVARRTSIDGGRSLAVLFIKVDNNCFSKYILENNERP